MNDEFCNPKKAEMIKLDSNNDYFAISLWDYSLPSICTGTSYYYGTMEEITHFVELLSRIERNGFEDTLAAFEQYKSGIITATHNVDYAETRLITPVILFGTKKQRFSHYEWTFFNTYNFPYYLKCDGGECTQIVVKRDNRYFRCLRFELTNLQYSSDYDEDEWDTLDGHFWGHPCMIEMEKIDESKYRLKSNLFAEGTEYESLNEAIDALKSDSVPEIDAFARDVFGDG